VFGKRDVSGNSTVAEPEVAKKGKTDAPDAAAAPAAPAKKK